MNEPQLHHNEYQKALRLAEEAQSRCKVIHDALVEATNAHDKIKETLAGSTIQFKDPMGRVIQTIRFELVWPASK